MQAQNRPETFDKLKLEPGPTRPEKPGPTYNSEKATHCKRALLGDGTSK